MFAALCLRHSVRDIGGSHFRPTGFQIQLTTPCNSTSSHAHAHTHTDTQQPPHASRSISERCVIILNIITAGLCDGGPALPNHIYIEWPKAEEVRPDSQTPSTAPTPPLRSCLIRAWWLKSQSSLTPLTPPPPLTPSPSLTRPEIDDDILFCDTTHKAVPGAQTEFCCLLLSSPHAALCDGDANLLSRTLCC